MSKYAMVKVELKVDLEAGDYEFAIDQEGADSALGYVAEDIDQELSRLGDFVKPIEISYDGKTTFWKVTPKRVSKVKAA